MDLKAGSKQMNILDMKLHSKNIIFYIRMIK